VRRELGVLPDARGLYKRLTARENIDYFGVCMVCPRICWRVVAMR
jgi:ABC-type Na+ transport system ATPase subunit NatA